MKFEKELVFTALDADEVKIGSRGFFADTLAELKEKVKESESSNILELEKVFDENAALRFSADNRNYALFYLVEEPKQKKYRPYHDSDEMVADFVKRFNVDCPFYEMPLIWIKNKTDGSEELVTSFEKKMIATESYNLGLTALLNDFTYLDGSPCGMEE